MRIQNCHFIKRFQTISIYKECGINQMVVDNECVNCLENQMAYYGRCFSCGLDEVIQADNVSYSLVQNFVNNLYNFRKVKENA